MRKLSILFALATVLSAGSAFADSDIKCTDVPQAQWKPAEEIQKMMEAEGYEVKKVETKGSCYEVYGLNKDKKQVEAYVDGATGKVVEVEMD